MSTTAVTDEKSYLRALVVDDDPDVSEIYRSHLQNSGFIVAQAATGSEAISQVSQITPDVVLLDLFLGKEDGLEILPGILKRSPRSRVWVLTANASIGGAVAAMRRGATGFFSKNEEASRVVSEIRSACVANRKLTRKVNPAWFAQQGIIGEGPAMLRLFGIIERLRGIDSTILIHGESGTGKELIARAIHRVSSRAEGPFAAINCGAIPENLLESELFGHKRGAFTDAKSDRKGIFETCSGGTLLLDEIGEMPFGLQVKLLRVLQEREVRPVGSSQCVAVDTRVLAATNRKLEEEVKRGRFREDLYYRLSVLRIDCPPLRDRKEDIPLLVDYFIERLGQRFDKKINRPSPEMLARLVSYEWPGNVRELQNSIERAVVLSEDGELLAENAFHSSMGEQRPATTSTSGMVKDSLSTARSNFEKSYLVELLKTTRGNVSEAARVADEHRPRLYRLFRKHGIDPVRYKLPMDQGDQNGSPN